MRGPPLRPPRHQGFSLPLGETPAPAGVSVPGQLLMRCGLAFPRKWKKPCFQGFFCSRPVSRILSRATISLGDRLPGRSSGVPGPSAGSVIGTCFALHRTGFGEPPRHRDAGGLLPHLFTLTSDICADCRWRSPFCATFRRLSPPGVSPASCPVVSGLSSNPKARGHPACKRNCSPGSAAPMTRDSHSGHSMSRPRWRTNSPQTRHSRLAPPPSAASSWSSVRARGCTLMRLVERLRSPCR